MKSMGTYSIWLKGSRKTAKRTVYKDGAKCHIKWYGQIIEVVRGKCDYATVELY